MEPNVGRYIPIAYCPMCGRLVNKELLQATAVAGMEAGAMATAEIMNPILQEKTIINDIQKAINESILNSVTRDVSGKLNLSKNFMKGGSM